MAKRMFLAFLVVLAAFDAATQGKDKDRVAVCHFGDGSDVALLALPRNAVDAHLRHGDVEAPPSVRTAADCLVPQPPPQPVTFVAATDGAGNARFVIPQTNIFAAVTVTSADGPVAGATIELLVIGNDWMVIATGGDRYGPAFAEGKLTDARPGSALRINVPITLPPPTSPPPPRLPQMVATRFTVVEECYTQKELEDYFNRSCSIALEMAKEVIFTYVTGRVVKVASWLLESTEKELCDDIAKQAAASMFAGRTLPMRIRTYTPPASPALQTAPVFFEDLGSCGGACCTGGTDCELRSSQQKCGGKYFPDQPCRADLCRVGACCDGSSCYLVAEFECAKRGGWYRGDDTPCTPDPCKKGACCDGINCLVERKIDCAAHNGVYVGDDTTCITDPCKKGACCDGTNCAVETKVDCAARNGTYRGDDTTCTPDPCKKGACCDGTNCSVETRIDCAARNGTYRGDDTTCTPDPCNKGACCDKRTGCTVLTAIECEARAGTFHGRDTDCSRAGTPTPLTYNFKSGGGAGGASFPIPYTHGTIRTTVTIPGNMSGTQCQRHWRVEVRVCPFNAGCSGGTWYAGQHFSICHTAPETITFQQLNSPLPCSHYSINALTGSVADVKVELLPQ